MKLIYTATFNVTTAAMLIKRQNTGESIGNGIMPNDIKITAITVEPVSASDTLQIRGIDHNSEWLTLRAGSGFTLERFFADDILFLYLKSSGTVATNLFVEGS
jgi:hypothetical protein